MSQNVIYTDGGCLENGKYDKKTKESLATGGFGIYLFKSCFGDKIKINCKGETMKINLNDVEEIFDPTNIRMEGLAIFATMFLYAEQFIFKKNIECPVEHLNKYFLKQAHPLKLMYSENELNQHNDTIIQSFDIITDSKFWIDVVHKYMPGWIRKNQLLTKSRKNADLILILYYYLTLFEQNKVKVNFTHVYSHQKGKRSQHADGNDIADALATSALKNSDTLFHLM